MLTANLNSCKDNRYCRVGHIYFHLFNEWLDCDMERGSWRSPFVYAAGGQPSWRGNREALSNSLIDCYFPTKNGVPLLPISSSEVLSHNCAYAPPPPPLFHDADAHIVMPNSQTFPLRSILTKTASKLYQLTTQMRAAK